MNRQLPTCKTRMASANERSEQSSRRHVQCSTMRNWEKASGKKLFKQPSIYMPEVPRKLLNLMQHPLRPGIKGNHLCIIFAASDVMSTYMYRPNKGPSGLLRCIDALS